MTEKEFLDKTRDKVFSGERLTFNDGVRLFECNDILALGELGRFVKQAKTGNDVYFVLNGHINLTNVCVSRCRFCAFSRDMGEEDSYVLSVDDVVRKVKNYLLYGITEVHIVSGLHPIQGLDYYIEVVRRIKEINPALHIQGFTAAEIGHLSRISNLSFYEVLKELKDAGLDALPAGGAEVFSPRVRKSLCPNKVDAGSWLNIMRIAHSLGLRTNASMLYGHIETIEERVEHLLALRELQDETGGFDTFIPLKFHPKNTALEGMAPASAVDDLKMIAVSRLMLDNFDHVKAFWIMLGTDVAQLSLEFGADDVDGTVIEERITHAAGAKTAQLLTVPEILAMIRQTGRTPVQRDTLYNVVKRYE